MRIRPFILAVSWLLVSLLARPAAAQTIDFGQQTVGTASSERLVGTFVNRGIFTSSFRFQITGDFGRGPSSTCGFTLGPGQSCVFYLVFTPGQVGARTGQLRYIQLGFTDTVWSLKGVGTPACSYSISPTSAAFSAAGGNGSVTVTAPANCAWTATKTVTWLTITSGANGSGKGTVRYSVVPNTGPARSTTITIAGKTFTVTQATGCAYSVSPTSASFPAAGGAGTVNVTTASGCSWTAASNAAWITVTSGASGTGSGSTQYNVASNGGAARTGTLMVAGTSVSVSETAVSLYSIRGSTGTPGVLVTTGSAAVVSDLNGNYLIGNLPAGTYTVSASKTDCGASPPRTVTLGPDAIGIDFIMACGLPTWRLTLIEVIPSDVYINHVWARNSNDAFLWGHRVVPGTSTTDAYLAHWDGHGWTQSFSLANAYATGLVGTGTSEVWLTAFSYSSGHSVVYRSTDNGLSWALQTLPQEIGASWVGPITGTPNNVQAAAGANRILRWNGATWTAISAGGITNGTAPYAMTMLGANDGFFTTCWGFGQWDGAAWTFHPGFDFCDVGSIYASRDAVTGQLFMLTGGNQNFSNGVRVWQYNGTDFGSKCGTVLADPTDGPYICGGIFAGNGSYGYATGIAGSSPRDVWVTGKLGYPTGTGRIYHFDGATWQNLTATVAALTGGTLPVTTAVFTTGPDDVWIILADGRVLRYTR